MPKKGHGRVMTAGLDSMGDYFSADVLKAAVERAEGKEIPITMGFDPTKPPVGKGNLEWDSVAKSITIRPVGEIDPTLLEKLELAAAGKLDPKHVEERDGVRHITKFEMTSVGLLPPGKKIETVEPE